MRFLRIILIMSIWAMAVSTAAAQMKIISREKVEAVSNPTLSSDSSVLVFDSIHIVADPMNEDDAPETFVYTFRNVGNDTIDILRLVSTCSCAVATCSAKTVASGASAQINVRYNPKGHPGRFERKVFVYTREGNSPAAVLKLTVDVSSGADSATLWPIQMGGIRLRTTEVTFSKGTKAIETISFINLSGKPLRLDCETAFMPACLTFRCDEVGNGEEGIMHIAYDPSKSGARESLKLILKGLGLPPSKSSITIRIK